jgi:hypothetical protein
MLTYADVWRLVTVADLFLVSFLSCLYPSINIHTRIYSDEPLGRDFDFPSTPQNNDQLNTHNTHKTQTHNRHRHRHTHTTRHTFTHAHRQTGKPKRNSHLLTHSMIRAFLLLGHTISNLVKSLGGKEDAENWSHGMSHGE